MKARIPSLHSALSRSLAALAAAGLCGLTAYAHPYASGVTNTAGTISFILNENADSVGVSFDNSTATNYLGALAKGSNSFSLSTHTNFQIYVAKVGSGSPFQISSDTNRYVNFWGPRGVAVNRSPKNANFGRTYVANAAAGTQPIGGTNGGPWGTRAVTRGIYALNADQSDAVGQGDPAKTAGMPLTNSATSTYQPYKISVGPDDQVYIGDASGGVPGGTGAGVWMAKPDLSGGVNLFPWGDATVYGGVVGTPIAFGSLAQGTLTLYALEWDKSPYQTIWRYDIGAGPWPAATAPVSVCNAGISSVNGVGADMNIGPDGKIYTLEYRATPGSGSIPVRVFDPTGAPLWNSWDNYGATYGDPYAYQYGIAISSDGKMMATVINSGNFAITQLVGGIPDPATYTVVTTGLGSTARGIAFDAANNVYLTTGGLAVMRVYSLGMTTLAITGNDWTGTNGTFQLVSPSTTVSVTTASPTVAEQGATSTSYIITRNNANSDYSSPLPVSFTFSGTATFGADYVTSATNTITIPAGQASVNVTITAVDDLIPELTESAILNLGGGGAYSTAVPRSAEVDIVDNETPQLRITALSTNIYEGNTNDYARLTLTRYGDTNQQVTLDYSSFAFGGTAVSNVDYYLTNLPYMIDFGQVTVATNLIVPIKHSTAVGSLSILLTNLAGTGYTVSNNTAATTLTLQAVPPETVLWSDNFENADDATNYNVFFATAAGAPLDDYTAMFYYDYSVQGPYPPVLLGPLPPAPHSTASDMHGLFLTVNKNDATPAGAALNLYPIGKSFSNNFALRFDMYLVQNSSSGTTEYSIFGINHSGSKTNWFRNSGTGVDGGWQFDGLWYDVETDGAALGDYVLYSSPTVTNTGVVNPTSIMSRNASTLTQVLKNPPYTSGSGGAPGNMPITQTPSWAEVEISQIGKVVTLKINNTVILSYTNSTAYTNGNIMLGYEDAYDSIGNGSMQAGEACVVYDNVRVVQLAPPTILTHPSNIVAAVSATTNFTVVASTTTGVANYQWYLGSSPIAGATSSTLNFAPVAKTSFGTYSVRVDDGAYSTYSASATLMPPLPVINVQPVSRPALLGSAPTFTVTATTYSGTTNYQWSYYATNYYGTNLLLGKYPAQAKTLTLTNVQAVSFTGPYTVKISDGYNTVTSSSANLTSPVSPGITGPAAVTGSNFRLSFSTEIGMNYIVDFKSALTNAAWIPLSTNAGTGDVIAITNSMTTPEGYYRIRLQ